MHPYEQDNNYLGTAGATKKQSQRNEEHQPLPTTSSKRSRKRPPPNQEIMAEDVDNEPRQRPVKSKLISMRSDAPTSDLKTSINSDEE